MNNEEQKVKQNRLDFDWGKTPADEEASKIVLEAEPVEPEKKETEAKETADSVQLSNGTVPSATSNHLYPLKTNLNTSISEPKSDDNQASARKKENSSAPQKLFHQDERSMFGIGKLLTQGRREKQLTTERVAEITRIRKDIIEHIEHDDFEKAPAPVYTRGYIRKMAELYQINTEQVVENYNHMLEGKRRKRTVTNVPKQTKAVIDDFDGEAVKPQGTALTPAGVHPTMMKHTKSKGFLKKIVIGSAAALIAIVFLDAVSSDPVADNTAEKTDNASKSSVKPSIQINDLLNYTDKAQLETITLEVPKTDIN